MKITLRLLKKDGACAEGLRWFRKAFPKGSNILEVFDKLLVDDHFGWGNWYLSKRFTKAQAVLYAIFAAKLSLDNFETFYPDDDRPRKAIEAAEKYINKPTDENMSAASAAWSAASAAASAAESAAAWSAASAAWSAASAAESAAESAAAWSAAAESATKKRILDYGLWLLGYKDV